MKLLNCSSRRNGEPPLARRPTTFKTGHVAIASLFTVRNLRPLSHPVNAEAFSAFSEEDVSFPN
jgi:hypothetical protein